MSVTTERRDDELTRAALEAGRGDRAALAALVGGTQADVWRYCAWLNGRDEADDLTQETFVRAIAALPRFAGASSARTWLLAIARRTAADSVRHAVRRRRLAERVQRFAPRSDTARGASGAVDLMQLVDQLPHERREAFVLTQLLGLEYAEAAEVVGCPIGTIRSRVARSRRDLVDATMLDQSAAGDEP